MPAKKIFAALFIIIVAVGGFVAGLYLLKQRQNIQVPGAVPTGEAKVSISPETGTVAIGNTFDATINFNTSGIPISGVAVQLLYPFSGTTPEVSVQSIRVSTGLSVADWSCPTQNFKTEGGNVVIDIACANTSSTGFTSSQNTQLATITFRADRQPITSPLVMRFDNANSVITRKSDNQDILLIPVSSGSYTIGEPSQVTSTATPTPTTRLTGTITPTRRVTVTVTPTLTTEITGELTATPTALPDTGMSAPTIMGVVFGAAVVFGAIMLAI